MQLEDTDCYSIDEVLLEHNPFGLSLAEHQQLTVAASTLLMGQPAKGEKNTKAVTLMRRVFFKSTGH